MLKFILVLELVTLCLSFSAAPDGWGIRSALIPGIRSCRGSLSTWIESTAATPDWFYKGRSQEKTHLQRLEFLLLRSPLDGARSVLTYRTRCSVAGQCDPVDWVFSTSGFHRLLATKPVSSETSEAERRSIGDHSSIRPKQISGWLKGCKNFWGI